MEGALEIFKGNGEWGFMPSLVQDDREIVTIGEKEKEWGVELWGKTGTIKGTKENVSGINLIDWWGGKKGKK